jgi:hypothetical protein
MELYGIKTDHGTNYCCAKKGKGKANISIIRIDGDRLEVFSPEFIKDAGFKKVRFYAFSDESLGLIIDCLKQRIKQCKEMQASGIHRVQIPMDCEIREINQLIDYIKETFSDEND